MRTFAVAFRNPDDSDGPLIGGVVVDLDVGDVDLCERVIANGGDFVCKHCRGMAMFPEIVALIHRHGAAPRLPRADANVADITGDPRVFGIPRNKFLAADDVRALFEDRGLTVH